MSTAAMAQTPAVPPRPTRSTDKDILGNLIPKVPPRPVNKQVDRSVSPRRDRFARSPLMQGIPSERSDIQAGKYHSQKHQSNDPVERARSVDLPSVGEEGMEYSAVASELTHAERRPSAPEQTRLVDESLKLHAPKPSLPASSAKQQVMAVTRTDSDKAASFGIGQPSTADDRAVSRGSNKKRPESIYSAHSDHTEDEHGIPEIGQRVPMNKHLGDVQAPSPGPGSESPKKNHHRKLSSRGLPPGSYGLHGHGLAPQDRLEKAYYDKHPEALQRERHTPHHDRQNDFAMSSSDLNKLVRDTANRQAATGSSDVRGTPTDDVAFEATEKYASRISSRPASIIVSNDESTTTTPQQLTDDKETVHVDDGKNPEFYHYGEGKDDEPEAYNAPILASDEVSKDISPVKHKPAIRPHLQRHDSSHDSDDPPSRPPSRPTSRPRMQRQSSQQKDIRHTPLEDVEEYDPLFPDDGKDGKAEVQESADEQCERHHFPSKDVWEDAPNSVHATAEVSTPDVPEQERRRSSANAGRPITPAQAFALYQEQLAEKESVGRSNSFLPLQESKPPTWIGHQAHLKSERPSCSRRFPSRDVWEDAPESHIHETEVSDSTDSAAEPAKPEIPARPAKKSSSSPERPEDSETSNKQDSEDAFVKPALPASAKPKPSIPPRPAKSSPGTTKDAGLSKPKPPVPNRPVGGKIAALQAGFMSDLNRRLQLGPQAVKKDDVEEEEISEEKEKTPLSDARKGRARGPQRRAPAVASTAAASAEAAKNAPVLSFSLPQTVWSMDPEAGQVACGSSGETAVPAPSSQLEPGEPGAATTDASKEPISTRVAQDDQAAAGPQELTSRPESKGRDSIDADVDSGSKRELTLASNTAGESILETVVQQDGDEVKPVEVHEDVKK